MCIASLAELHPILDEHEEVAVLGAYFRVVEESRLLVDVGAGDGEDLVA